MRGMRIRRQSGRTRQFDPPGAGHPRDGKTGKQTGYLPCSAVFSQSEASLGCLELLPRREVAESIGILIRDQVDVATASTVAAVGSAHRNVLLPAKTDAAAAAMAALDVNSGFVEEHMSMIPAFALQAFLAQFFALRPASH